MNFVNVLLRARTLSWKGKKKRKYTMQVAAVEMLALEKNVDNRRHIAIEDMANNDRNTNSSQKSIFSK